MKDCGEKIIFPQFDTIIFTFAHQFPGNFSEKRKNKVKNSYYGRDSLEDIESQVREI